MAGGPAAIAGDSRIGRRKPLITSRLCTKVRRRKFKDGNKDPCELLICQKSQEVSLELLFGHMDFLSEGGCDDIIARCSCMASGLRHKDELFCEAHGFIFIEVL